MESYTKYNICKINKSHLKNQFNSGNIHLDHYIKTQANQDIKKNAAITYVLTKNNDLNIIGFYTLSSLGIVADEMPKDMLIKTPRYPILPAALIGRLAVDINFREKKIGSALLIDAIKRILTISEQIGIIAIIVDAKNDDAVRFYKKFNFIELSIPKRLFLPISKLKNLDIF